MFVKEGDGGVHHHVIEHLVMVLGGSEGLEEVRLDLEACAEQVEDGVVWCV